MSDQPSFFDELKRRNVIRVAGLYLVGAWLLIQIASTMLPAFDVPAWALRGLIIILALGFIPALVFSWVFELTPNGSEARRGRQAGGIHRATNRAPHESHDHRGAGARAGLFLFR